MVTRRSFLLASALPALAPLGTLSPLYANTAASSTMVIVTLRTSSLAEISLRDLKWLYTGEQVNGPGGAALLPFNHVPRSPVRVAFDQLVLKMTADEVGRFWVDRRIRGQTGAPRAVPALDMLRKVIVALPNAVTYLLSSDVVPELKVLSVDGKSTADPAYPLRFE
ncbi:MAG: hypothetical protein RL033_6444 [Pseudomonadota bacterium]|jgi:hypothetical protein